MPGDRPRILLIEDSIEDARMIGELLAKTGSSYHLESVRTLSAALGELAGAGADVALLDLELPDITGMGAIERLNEAFPFLPIVALTDSEKERDEREAIRRGAQDYLVKGHVDGKLILRACRHAMERKRLKRELEWQREFASMIVETLEEAVVVLDPDLRVISANRSYYQIFQTTPEDIEGRLFYEVSGGQWDVPPLRKALGRVLPEDARLDRFEVEMDSARLGRRCMLLNARRLYRPTNDTRMILVAIEDITERRAAEAAVRDSEARYRSLFEGSRDAIIITTPEGRTVDCNQAMLDLFGYTREEMLSMDAAERFPDPADRERLRQAIREKGYVKDFEGKRRKKDGAVMECLLTSIRRETPEGKVFYQGIIRDVTEKKRAEAALKEYSTRLEDMVGVRTRQLQEASEELEVANEELRIANEELHSANEQLRAANEELEVANEELHVEMNERALVQEELLEAERRYHLVFDTMLDGFALHEIICDGAGDPADYRFLDLNPAFQSMTGLGREVIGKTVRQVIPGVEDRWIEAYGKVALTGESARFEDHSAPLDKWFEVLVFSPAPGQFVTVFRDISRRKRAEEELQAHSDRLEELVEERASELREAQEQLLRQERLAALGQLAASMAHELRNPLAVIANAAYYLRSVLSQADPVTADYLEMISSEAQASGRIISDLLGFTQSPLAQREKTEVSSIVEGALLRKPPPSFIDAEIHIPADLPPVFVDRRQIEQALANLLGNAYQAMGEEGGLAIDARQEGMEIHLLVSDTGCGVPPENLGRIFEPLFTNRARGLGLGLAIARRLAEANGGRIEVQSRVGEGSTFTVSLPADQSDGPAGQPGQPAADGCA